MIVEPVPAVARKPSVVYFHSNTLPETTKTRQGPHDLVNLSTATAANEIWFTSGIACLVQMYLGTIKDILL